MNGLDPAGMHEMREFIREENRERGVTFFLSSHLLDDIQRLCDRIGILHKGLLVAEGRIGDLLSSAVTGFRLRVERTEVAVAALARRAARRRSARSDGEGTIHVQGDATILAAAPPRAARRGRRRPIELFPVRASLEAYFLDLTEGVMG